jgi:hypothetical protein
MGREKHLEDLGKLKAKACGKKAFKEVDSIFHFSHPKEEFRGWRI